mgnify:CR=1 FL=1
MKYVQAYTSLSFFLPFCFPTFSIILQIVLCAYYRDEFDKKKEGVEKMLLDLVLKVDTTVPKARSE